MTATIAHRPPFRPTGTRCGVTGNVYRQRGEFSRWVNAQFVHQQQHSPVKTLVICVDSAVALQHGV
ncbi:Uncharacterised protein [Pantoea agglomerans]|uniref:Uncharacterized protein n=1 Tax=Enterobacter agglomerans TaxID=549 RepID=A0A379LUR1_ENTAG|nr:Uncharacterised protein [Pantoea agglomerans]